MKSVSKLVLASLLMASGLAAGAQANAADIAKLNHVDMTKYGFKSESDINNYFTVSDMQVREVAPTSAVVSVLMR